MAGIISMNENNNQKHVGVLFVRGTTIDIYIPSFSTTVFSFPLSSEVYSEMEIKNVELAMKLTSDFFLVNKIPPTEFVLILQTPLFKKEFPIAPQEKLEKSINIYLDYIPFDSVLSKRIKTDSGVMIIATNGDLIQSLHKMVSAASCTIECATALEGLPIFPKGGLTMLTQPSAEIILKSSTLIKQESFSLTPLRSVEGFEVVEEEEETKEKSNLPLLVAVFIVLLVILGVVYLSSNTPISSATPQNNISPTSSVSEYLSPTKIPRSTTSILSISPIPSISVPLIKLTNTQSTTVIHDKIKAQLIASGFTSITEDSSSDTTTSRSFVIYSPTITPSVRASIQAIIKSAIPTIVENPSRESSYDVMIIIGK